MTRVLTAIGLVFAMSSAIAAENMTPEDRKIIDSCVAMTDEFMLKDKACTEAMRRTNVAQADIQMIRTCRSMTEEAMDRDKQCGAMRAKYPDIVVSTGSAATTNAGGRTNSVTTDVPTRR